MTEQEVSENLMFYRIKKKILSLCKIYNIPKPKIIKMGDDPTSEEHIFLNMREAGDLSLEGDQEYYARHVFIHYLCKLEKVPKYSNTVVDLILEWMAIDLINKETTPSA
jgi:hypothetical protein